MGVGCQGGHLRTAPLGPPVLSLGTWLLVTSKGKGCMSGAEHDGKDQVMLCGGFQEPRDTSLAQKMPTETGWGPGTWGQGYASLRGMPLSRALTQHLSP